MVSGPNGCVVSGWGGWGKGRGGEGRGRGRAVDREHVWNRQSKGIRGLDQRQQVSNNGTINDAADYFNRNLLICHSLGVSCGPLAAPSNGRVDTSAGTSFGDTATYSCDTGFRLRGRVTRKCRANGLWNGKKPTCESEKILNLCLYIHNSILPHILQSDMLTVPLGVEVIYFE